MEREENSFRRVVSCVFSNRQGKGGPAMRQDVKKGGREPERI